MRVFQVIPMAGTAGLEKKFCINLAVSQTSSLIGFGPQRTATILLRILQRQHNPLRSFRTAPEDNLARQRVPLLPVKILLKVWGRWAKVRLHLLRRAAAQTQSGLSYFFKKLNYYRIWNKMIGCLFWYKMKIITGRRKYV